MRSIFNPDAPLLLAFHCPRVRREMPWTLTSYFVSCGNGWERHAGSTISRMRVLIKQNAPMRARGACFRKYRKRHSKGRNKSDILLLSPRSKDQFLKLTFCVASPVANCSHKNSLAPPSYRRANNETTFSVRPRGRPTMSRAFDKSWRRDARKNTSRCCQQLDERDTPAIQRRPDKSSPAHFLCQCIRRGNQISLEADRHSVRQVLSQKIDLQHNEVLQVSTNGAPLTETPATLVRGFYIQILTEMENERDDRGSPCFRSSIGANRGNFSHCPICRSRGITVDL